MNINSKKYFDTMQIFFSLDLPLTLIYLYFLQLKTTDFKSHKQCRNTKVGCENQMQQRINNRIFQENQNKMPDECMNDYKSKNRNEINDKSKLNYLKNLYENLFTKNHLDSLKKQAPLLFNDNRNNLKEFQDFLYSIHNIYNKFIEKLNDNYKYSEIEIQLLIDSIEFFSKKYDTELRIYLNKISPDQNIIQKIRNIEDLFFTFREKYEALSKLMTIYNKEIILSDRGYIEKFENLRSRSHKYLYVIAEKFDHYDHDYLIEFLKKLNDEIYEFSTKIATFLYCNSIYNKDSHKLWDIISDTKSQMNDIKGTVEKYASEKYKNSSIRYIAENLKHYEISSESDIKKRTKT